MDGVRIDKWLWAARFFKTRSLAAHACELGRVHCNKQPIKPSRTVRIGELLDVRTASGEFELEVLLLSEIRGPAPVAQTLYRETESSRERREKIAQDRKAGMYYTPSPAGRPSKRDRRRIRQFRGEM
ncbi:MAG TPA: RNA-binding S4 domain-containing protein [Terriglobales bacterium]|nr:RNA-binding S4 domain-containing protein [Terriglobales bacterium]